MKNNVKKTTESDRVARECAASSASSTCREALVGLSENLKMQQCYKHDVQ